MHMKISFHITLVVICFSQSSNRAESIEPVEILIPEMVLIEGGRFEMGSLVDIQAQPIHEETIRPFFMSKFEVTFDQFDYYTRMTGKAERNDLGWGRDNRPVVDVTWDDAFQYAAWLSAMTGQTYRLPTEAEWEYAARAKSEVAQYSWGNQAGSKNANCRDVELH